MTMKTYALVAFDESPKITQVEKPTPGAGEVLVKVRAASVNGFDLSVANGYLQGMMEHRFPVVLGKDFAGTVEAVGEDVDGYAVGDRVFGVVTKDFLGDGSFGEYVTVPVSVGIAKLPENVDFTRAGALGLAGTAAVDSFDGAAITEGQTVLVFGATGGVGQQAVQLAARAGATVIATADTQKTIASVTALGAAHTVDFTGDISAQLGDIAPGGVDVVMHFAGDPGPLITLVKSGGKFVSTMLGGPDAVQAEGVEVVSIYANPSQETLDRVAANESTGHTRVNIQQVFPLAETDQAFAAFTAGTLGKIAISVN